jgi:methylated-DNA-[protein]-cysteine S-methyltransferase
LNGDGEALTGLYMEPHPSFQGRRDDAALRPAREQLQSYFDGALWEFDLPLAPGGTAFQQEVWAALRAIPYGTTVSYAELARRVGRPRAARAVGSANGRNPIGIVVPCHRVIASHGALGGYGGGLERKKWLLGHEADALARAKRAEAVSGL